MVEGTQGFGLSLYHARDWPYRTSRDTTAASFLGEAGLGGRQFEVIMALRTFPIRVGETPATRKRDHLGGSTTPERVLPSDSGIHRHNQAPAACGQVPLGDGGRSGGSQRPSRIALQGTDYLDHRNRSVTRYGYLTPDTREFVEELEARTGVPASILGTGPANEEIIDRRSAPEDRTSATETTRG